MRPGFPERGSFGDKFSEIERRLQALESANRLTSASIGSGGLTVKDGGDITLEGGTITVNDGGTVNVGPADNRIIIDHATDNFPIGSGNFADSVIEFDLDWLHSSIVRNAAIAVDNATGGLDALFLFGPGTGTSLPQDSAYINLAIDSTTGDRFASVVSDDITLSGTNEVRIQAGNSGTITLGLAGKIKISESTDEITLTGGTVLQQDTPATTGSAANATWTLISGTNYELQRSTSSLAYKPDWQYADLADTALPRPITWTDEKGQRRVGFGAEHVHESIPEAYEIENYDLRSVVAVLSAKVARLEGA